MLPVLKVTAVPGVLVRHRVPPTKVSQVTFSSGSELSDSSSVILLLFLKQCIGNLALNQTMLQCIWTWTNQPTTWTNLVHMCNVVILAIVTPHVEVVLAVVCTGV